MKNDTSTGIAPMGDGLAWARASRARHDRPVAQGSGPFPAHGTEGATLVLGSGSALFRAESVPSSDADEIAEIMRNQLETESPLDPEQMVFSHEILRREGERTLVLAAAAPVATVEALREKAAVPASRVDRVDVALLGLLRLLRGRPEVPAEGRVPVLAEEGGSLHLALLEGGVPVLLRSAGPVRAAAGGRLANAIRLAALQAEMSRGSAPLGPVLLVSSDATLRDAGRQAAEALGVPFRTLDPATLPPPAFGAALRTVEGEGMNLFPDAWRSALDDRRYRRRFAFGIAVGAVLWLVLFAFLYGFPWLLERRLRALENESEALAPAEAEVDQIGGRLLLIDEYSDRTYSPLETLLEVCLAMPQDVELSAFTYTADPGNALLEITSPTQQKAFDFFERLKPSPLFARTEFVTPPAQDRNSRRVTSSINLTFTTNTVHGTGGGAP